MVHVDGDIDGVPLTHRPQGVGRVRVVTVTWKKTREAVGAQRFGAGHSVGGLVVQEHTVLVVRRGISYRCIRLSSV